MTETRWRLFSTLLMFIFYFCFVLISSYLRHQTVTLAPCLPPRLDLITTVLIKSVHPLSVVGFVEEGEQ